MLHGSVRTQIIFFGVCVVLALLCGTLFWYVETYHSFSMTSVNISEEPSCAVAAMIGELTTPGEAVRVGDSYLGEGTEYDLLCARMAFERSIALDPRGHLRAWHQLGRVDFLEGDFDAAIENLANQFTYFGDELPNVHYMLGLTYGYRARKYGNVWDWKRAEDEFRRFISINATSPWARTDLAWVLFAQGKYEEMKPVLEEGLSSDPTSPWLLNMYGLALMNTGNKASAHQAFVDALRYTEAVLPEQWGRAYPGNDPRTWAGGLAEMRESLQKNIDLSSDSDS